MPTEESNWSVIHPSQTAVLRKIWKYQKEGRDVWLRGQQYKDYPHPAYHVFDKRSRDEEEPYTYRYTGICGYSFGINELMHYPPRGVVTKPRKGRCKKCDKILAERKAGKEPR